MLDALEVYIQLQKKPLDRERKAAKEMDEAPPRRRARTCGLRLRFDMSAQENKAVFIEAMIG